MVNSDTKDLIGYGLDWTRLFLLPSSSNFHSHESDLWSSMIMDSCVTFGEVKVVEDEGERRSMKTGEIRKKNPETNERYQNLDSSFTFGDLISSTFGRLARAKMLEGIQREDDS